MDWLRGAVCCGLWGLASAYASPQPSDERDAALLVQWRQATPDRAADALRFEQWLGTQGLLAQVPLHELLRSASSWRLCAAEPFALPPPAQWPQVQRVLSLLKTLRERGLLGPVEVHSAYRDEALNRCAGGAPGSAHVREFAIDFTPLGGPEAKAAVAQALCQFWRQEGPTWQMGLGQYASGRLHIDTWRYRTWGAGQQGGLCGAA
jgi:Peptidase M15